MITVTVFKDRQDRFKGFSSSGHAGYGDYGQDIVCSAVSALVINTVNALQSLTSDNDFELYSSEETGDIRVTFSHDLSEKGEVLVKAMVLGLQSIQNEYDDKYIRVIFKEV